MACDDTSEPAWKHAAGGPGGSMLLGSMKHDEGLGFRALLVAMDVLKISFIRRQKQAALREKKERVPGQIEVIAFTAETP